MDQRLAVEAEIAALRAFGGEAVDIADVAVRPVENFQPVGARRQDAMRDHRDHRRAARLHPDPRLPRDVVGPEHEAGEPRFGILGRGGELVGIEHGARGLDHGPDPDRGVGVDVAAGGRRWRRDRRRWRSSGTRMPSGAGLAGHADRSSTHQGVSSALMRIRTSRLPNPPAATAFAIWSRALALASGATESSRSRMMPSAGSIARLFQRPRVRSRHEQQAAARTGHGLSFLAVSTFGNPRHNISGRAAESLVPRHRSMVRQGPSRASI